MKINCGPSKEQRYEAAREYWCQWRLWFAWRPVRVGPEDCRWLEFVERKADWVGSLFEPFKPYDFKYRVPA